MLIVDAFATPLFWRAEDAPAFLRKAAEETFRVPAEEIFRERSPQEFIEAMNAAGVTHALVHAVEGREDDVRAFVDQHPERLRMSTEVDPRQGMAAVQRVRRMVDDFDVRLIRVMPFVVGKPANANIFYPVFAVCAELGVPVSVHTGMSPLAAVPADIQDPIHLDEIARFFPELSIVMAHGADPWWAVAIRLLKKHANLFMMTSAWAPRHLPEELITAMSRRIAGKVMFGTDYPMLTMERCVREAKQLPLEADSAVDYFSGTAAQLFWDGDLGGWMPDGSPGQAADMAERNRIHGLRE
jgi:predicted TIM-barrel fold metal-dependent hydrolase